MVVESNVVGIAIGLVHLHLGDAGEQFHTLDRMGFDHLILFRRQPPLLVQDGVGDGDFAYVVGDGSHPDQIDLLLAQPLPQRGIAQHITGDIPDPAYMLSRFIASEFDGGGQCLHHTHTHFCQFSGLKQQLVPLPLHLRTQQGSGMKELHHRVHPPSDHIGDHRLGDHVHHPKGIGLLHSSRSRVRSNQKDRNLLQNGPLLLQMSQHLQAVHGRHDHIQQDRADGLLMFLQQLQALLAVLRLQYSEFIPENIGQYGTIDLIVVHHKEHSLCPAHLPSLPVESVVLRQPQKDLPVHINYNTPSFYL